MPAAILLDIDLPDGSGLDVLRQVKEEHPETVVIMITGNVMVDNTIAALRGGAYDFIGKPINLEELRITIRNGIEARQLRREVEQVRNELARQFNFRQIVGDSPAMKKMLALAAKVAESEVSSVLLQGESGTGKDLVAKAIHYGSQRAENPFVAINCAALPAPLIESELFGASNRDLRTESEAGRFRLDLYYRLSIIQIDIPPLRERGDDVLLLSQHYIDTISSRLRLRRKITGLSPEVMSVFRSYNWPGNVRELRNVIERSLILEESDTISTEYLPAELLDPARRIRGSTADSDCAGSWFSLPSKGISLDEAEMSFVQQAIERSGGNQTRAAELLGISRDQLRYRLKKLDDARANTASAVKTTS